MAKSLKIPAPTGVFVFDLTEALQDDLGGFFRGVSFDCREA